MQEAIHMNNSKVEGTKGKSFTQHLTAKWKLARGREGKCQQLSKVANFSQLCLFVQSVGLFDKLKNT